jgi:hypothetical protein
MAPSLREKPLGHPGSSAETDKHRTASAGYPIEPSHGRGLALASKMGESAMGSEGPRSMCGSAEGCVEWQGGKDRRGRCRVLIGPHVSVWLAAAWPRNATNYPSL